MALLPGQTIGSYRIVEQIGIGGMATVYKAFQPSLARHVAVKVLPASYAEAPGFLERFQQEAMVVARLRHPSILVVFDAGQENGTPYIVMELVEGGTLGDRMRGAVPPREAVALLRPVAAALDFAHEQGVVHRDVKPSNVLLTVNGAPILADFGIARIAEAQRRLTRTGVGIGTPEYMAPEQAMGLEAGPASDNYALGVIAYEMLTGAPPFAGPNPMAVAIAHAQRPAPPARARNPSLSVETEAVLLRALQKRPEDRYASATELVDALELSTSTQSAIVRSEAAPTLPRTVQSTPLRPPETPFVPAGPVDAHGVAGDPVSATKSGAPTIPVSAPAAAHRPRVRRYGAAAVGIVALLAAVGLGLRAASQDPPIVEGTPAQRSPATGASPSSVGASPAPLLVLYEDDFSDPGEGRLAKTSPNASQYLRGYADGEYQLKVIDPGLRSIVNATVPGIHADAILSVDAHLVGDTQSRYVEVACRAQSDNTSSYYRLAVDPTRRWFRLVRLDRGAVVALVDWTPSDAIARGTASNRIELRCVGDVVSVAINGTEVASVQDSTYSSGRMWIGLSSVGRVGEARFDNLKVIGRASASGRGDGI